MSCGVSVRVKGGRESECEWKGKLFRYQQNLLVMCDIMHEETKYSDTNRGREREREGGREGGRKGGRERKREREGNSLHS